MRSLKNNLIEQKSYTKWQLQIIIFVKLKLLMQKNKTVVKNDKSVGISNFSLVLSMITSMIAF
jgi:hypothetical protein